MCLAIGKFVMSVMHVSQLEYFQSNFRQFALLNGKQLSRELRRMRQHILLFVNGQQHQVTGADAFLTLSNFLRLRLKLCGTKIVCSEGDCGSCSVLLGQLDKESKSPTLKYNSIDSCIAFVNRFLHRVRIPTRWLPRRDG